MAGKLHISIDSKLKIVRVSYEGQLGQETSSRLISEAGSKAYDLNYNLLYDFSKAVINISYAEMYFFTRTRVLLTKEVANKVKSTNIVPNNEDMKSWLFMKDTARNAGLNFRTFNNEKTAIDWLIEG